jgi:hypothetical protein
VADVIFVLAIVAFFALCVLYVRGCERIIRAGETGGEAGQTAHDLTREVVR